MHDPMHYALIVVGALLFAALVFGSRKIDQAEPTHTDHTHTPMAQTQRRAELIEDIDAELLARTRARMATELPMPAWERELLAWDNEHLSGCEYGCKLYDGVLVHSFVYGCPQAKPSDGQDGHGHLDVTL